MKVMISQPMKDRKEEEILEERNNIIKKFEEMHIEVIDTYFKDEDTPIDMQNEGVYFLGKSLEKLSKVDAIFMADGWIKARGCKIEHQVAREYGIKILYSDFFENKPEIGTRNTI